MSCNVKYLGYSTVVTPCSQGYVPRPLVDAPMDSIKLYLRICVYDRDEIQWRIVAKVNYNCKL